MSYLRFDKTLMTNLEDSLPKEVLRSNRSGAYSCSTIVDCNTRKYHGLLVVPVPELDQENHVLLSSLDATVIQHGAEFNLGLHKYSGDNFSPRGHKYIREFDSLKVPTTIYRVGGVILKKEQMFQHFEDRIIIRYTLVDAHSETTLRLQPFLAFRSVREYTHENSLASREYHEVQGGIRTCMYEGYPELFMQLDKENNFVYNPNWYKGVDKYLTIYRSKEWPSIAILCRVIVKIATINYTGYLNTISDRQIVARYNFRYWHIVTALHNSSSDTRCIYRWGLRAHKEHSNKKASRLSSTDIIYLIFTRKHRFKDKTFALRKRFFA